MKVVIAPDSFKECLSAAAVAKGLATGWRRAQPDANLVCVAMADGGEGTVDAILAATGAKGFTHAVSGPDGRRVTATWALLEQDATSIIEMASAAGLTLLAPDERDPTTTTTRGVGELLLTAIDHGARRIIVGLGGSATNDAGAGMAQALGYRLLDAGGNELSPGGLALAQLAHIDPEDRNPRLDAVTVIAATDVRNPLCGPEGASVVFGPQKGADAETVKRLDDALDHFARIVERDLGIAVRDQPGAGAAGGLGAGLIAFAGATLQPGVSLIADIVGLRDHLRDADYVITGEGRLDAQSLAGKTPVGVAGIAAELGIPIIMVAGCLGRGWEAVRDRGILAVHALTTDTVSAEDAQSNTTTHLEDLGEQLAREWGTS